MIQLSIIDYADKKLKDDLTPELWKCTTSCSNYNCHFENGSIDRFPSTNEPRCINAKTSSKLINNIWITKCINYRFKSEAKNGT